MKPANIVYFALLASPLTTAAPLSAPVNKPRALTERHLGSFVDETIKHVIESVIDSTNSLQMAVSGWSGKVADTAPILAGSDGVLKSLKSGTATIEQANDLSLVGLLGIVIPTIHLNEAVEGVSDALIDKKPQFAAAGLSTVVLGQLQDQRKAAQAMVDTLLTKMPSYTTSLGELLSAPSLKSLDEAIDVYSAKGWKDPDHTIVSGRAQG
ncbi:hypothetical protein FKW77_000162 [Venturia effusa]|uniref:Cell wall galactomannoprotein n=1 Tax=Venturia effusa TaxID=50376 RepID=A0A517LJI2_9PEZI|nr:hypothetical protein FKW77_000162 [Venturia effusa]